MGRRLMTGVVALAMILVGTPWGSRVALAIDGGSGSASLIAIGTTYLQDFDSLTNSPDAFLSNVLPDGWLLSESGAGARNDGKYAVGTGSSATGDHYSFGTPVGNSDRALGELRSGSLIPIFGASFTNNTGAAITRLDIAYTGEQWRLGAARVAPERDRIDFQYSVTATGLTAGTWVDVDALDFSSPVTTGTAGALNGNLSANRTTLAANLFVTVPAGATFWIRWTDVDVSSSDDGLAVDSFSLTPRLADAPPSVSSRAPEGGASGVAPDANVTIGFSEAVSLGEAWFAISCANSGTHIATVSSAGPNAYRLDPTVNFGNDELCTVTVYATQVSDFDTDDPPDHLAGDDVFTFRTLDIFACGGPATPIHAVQGSGSTTPLTGQTVTIEGVVVGDYQLTPSQFGGFYVQEEPADNDADPTTSEGIFVFRNATGADVNVGDVVRVTGRAGESSGLTQLSSVSAVTVCATGATVSATPVSFPVPSVTYLERFEGMRVSFAQTLTATEVFNLGRFGEVSLSGTGRLYTPTAVADPGAPASAVADLNARSRIILDDSNNLQNIDPTRYPQGGLSASNTLRVGDTLPGLTGVMDFRFGNYRIQPVGLVAFDHTNARTSSPAAVGGNLKVASFNVLNFFNGDGLGGGFPTPRGASTANEFQRQRAKEVSALKAMNADIVGLMELENDASPRSAIEDLVEGLNTAMGAGTYAFIDTGIIGTDAIKVGLIYKPAVVTPLGAYRAITSSVDPRFIDTLNRPSLAQTFVHLSTSQKLTVVVNHLKSKGSNCNSVGDPDVGDGQGNCNRTRTAAAEALVSWLASDPTGSGDPDFLLIGDMNAYTHEDPIATFISSGFTNLVAAFGGASAYSYVFNGESGYLDHALATSTLASQVTGATDWHINPDEPTVLDYNTEFKTTNQVTTFYDAGPYRSSDHDPVVIGLRFTDDTRPTVEAPPSVTAHTALNAPGCTTMVSDAALGSATASDNSGVVTVTRTGVPAGNVFPVGVTTVTYTATDGSGNMASATQTVTVIDRTPPTISAPANVAYQLVSQVPAATAADATASDNCGAPVVTVSEANNGGAGSPASPLVITRTYTATDTAGNHASATQTITVIDSIAPTITGATTTAPNTNGWWNMAVTVHFTCTDNSGVVTCPPDVTLSGDGADQSVTRTATDAAGNTATATVSDIDIDRTAPTITFTGATRYTPDQTVNLTCVATDALSGIDPARTNLCPSAGGPAYLFVGTTTLNASAWDRAGNNETATLTFTVGVTSESICALVERYVSKDGVAHSLCTKIQHAAERLAEGRDKNFENELKAFTNEVNAQRGKSISDANATLLITLAGML